VSAGSVLERRVRLRPDVRTSRALQRGPAVVHRVKDPRTGSAFEIEAREHFLITRLDGSRTLAEIGDEYAAAFGRRLAEPHWLQLLTLLGSRGLLDPAAGGPTPVGPTAGSGTVRAVEAVHERARTVLRPSPLIPSVLLTLAVATVLWLTFRVGALLDDAGWLVRHPVLLVAAAAVIWLSGALHELGHGVAALWHGCRVTKVSLAALHCRIDGYLYLPSVPAQLAIAGIGGVVNALVLVPMAVAWSALPADAALHPWLGGVLFFGLVQTLVNYVPLPPLDGYRMLGHALRTADLASGSLTFLRAAARREPATAAYGKRAKCIYTGYGLIALALVTGALTGAVIAARALAHGRLGAAGVVTAIVAVSMTIAGRLARPARQHRTNQKGEQR